MTVAELQAELAKGTLRPAYLLAGEEPLLRDDALAAIRAAVLEEGSEEWNLQRLDGARTSPAELHDALRSLPVLAARRLVVLREPEAGRSGGLGEALAQALAEAAGGAETVLVVLAARADKRTRWAKALAGGRVDCAAPQRPRDVVAFARAEAARQGLKLGAGAAELLAERLGPQLLMLRQEIAKAALLAGPGKRVERAHVGAGTPAVAEERVFELTDAIGEGRGADALAALARLLGGGAAPPQLLGVLAGHFRRLLRVRSGERLAGHPFVLRKLESQAGRSSPARLEACLRAIHRTDLALKGEGSLPPERALERLVLGLVR